MKSHSTVRYAVLNRKIIQLLSVATIAFVSFAPVSEAESAEFAVCTWCDVGPSECLPNDAYVNDCLNAGCSGALPGCAAHFGNCQDGVRIGCNEES